MSNLFGGGSSPKPPAPTPPPPTTEDPAVQAERAKEAELRRKSRGRSVNVLAGAYRGGSTLGARGSLGAGTEP